MLSMLPSVLPTQLCVSHITRIALVASTFMSSSAKGEHAFPILLDYEQEMARLPRLPDWRPRTKGIPPLRVLGMSALSEVP